MAVVVEMVETRDNGRTVTTRHSSVVKAMRYARVSMNVTHWVMDGNQLHGVIGPEHKIRYTIDISQA